MSDNINLDRLQEAIRVISKDFDNINVDDLDFLVTSATSLLADMMASKYLKEKDEFYKFAQSYHWTVNHQNSNALYANAPLDLFDFDQDFGFIDGVIQVSSWLVGHDVVEISISPYINLGTAKKSISDCLEEYRERIAQLGLKIDMSSYEKDFAHVKKKYEETCDFWKVEK